MDNKQIQLPMTTQEKVTERHLNHAAATRPGVSRIRSVEGLSYLPDFLSSEEQANCIRNIDAAQEEWRNDLTRRVQHYGWRYDYRAKAITPEMHLGQLPDWLQKIALKIFTESVGPDGQQLFPRAPEQVIINEYLTGQGIANHIDHPGFGPAICTISLLEEWEMQFSVRRNDEQPAMLEQGSCLLMTGPARHRWYHGIRPAKFEFDRTPRIRRLSMTFRTVNNLDGPND